MRRSVELILAASLALSVGCESDSETKEDEVADEGVTTGAGEGGTMGGGSTSGGTTGGGSTGGGTADGGSTGGGSADGGSSGGDGGGTDGASATAPAWPEEAAIIGSDVTSDSLTITWDAATDDEGVTGYIVHMDGAEIADLGGSMTSYDVTSLAPTTPYDFEISATDASGNVTPGPSATITTLAEGTPPMSGTLVSSYVFSTADACVDDCGEYTEDGECDDGGPGAPFVSCELGADCSDCGQRRTCTITINLSPGSTLYDGCTECDFTWSIKFDELINTCDEKWSPDQSGYEMSLGIDVESSTLHVNHGDGWGAYGDDSPGSSEIVGTTFTGSGDFMTSAAEYPDLATVWAESTFYSYTEVFTLTW